MGDIHNLRELIKPSSTGDGDGNDRPNYLTFFLADYI